MLSERKKRPSLSHTRLRFGRRPPQPEPLAIQPFGWQTLATMDLSEYDEDLIELKRRCEAKGMNIQIPKRGATFELPDPIDFGEPLSDIVIRNRGKDEPAPRQTFESMDLSEYDEDLVDAKRRAEAEGVYIWIPKRGATIELPDPIDFGESLSDIVIRNRGREP